ncbi:hypothetical protein D9757_005043 [Collybiopsis confluens]|uniref:Uncharacterized protein n=1 Tax=Collybiopsis confluens TaxID=2823264 RepID=A0A8H5HTI9_9AGAR|nr:hypothetical protein D9757_005043 [Collybiopsis confluens]
MITNAHRIDPVTTKWLIDTTNSTRANDDGAAQGERDEREENTRRTLLKHRIQLVKAILVFL